MTITRLRNSDPQIIWHDSVSASFRRGYQALTAEQGPPSMMFRYVATNPPPFTTTEAVRRLQPSGKDRWLFDVLRDHQMSDNLACVIGPWVVTYWIERRMRNKTAPSQPTRIALNANASIAVLRLKEIMERRKPAIDEVRLSPRELTVMRHLAIGQRLPEVAEHLDMSVTTARTYLRRAQKKLDAKTPLHAAVMASQRGLI